MFGNVCVANFVDNFGIIFGNLQIKGGILAILRKLVGNLSQNRQKRCYQHVYIIRKITHGWL